MRAKGKTDKTKYKNNTWEASIHITRWAIIRELSNTFVSESRRITNIK